MEGEADNPRDARQTWKLAINSRSDGSSNGIMVMLVVPVAMTMITAHRASSIQNLGVERAPRQVRVADANA